MEIFAIVGYLCQVIGFNELETVSQGHVPEALVVAIGFTVRSNVHELGPAPAVVKRADQPLGKGFSALEQTLEGNPSGDRAIIEKECDLFR
jgi:hypothetical protein